MVKKNIKIFKRTAISVMAAVCALSSAASLSANAKSTSSRQELSNGYVVTTTATRTTYTASGKAEVTSGGSTSIKLVTKGFFTYNGDKYSSTKTKISDNNSCVEVKPFEYYKDGKRFTTYKVKSTGTYRGETTEPAVVK